MYELKILHPRFMMNYFASFYNYAEQYFKDIEK